MDNKKGIRWIMLLFMLILLVALSLIKSGTVENGTQKPGEAAEEQTTEPAPDNIFPEGYSPSLPESDESQTTGQDLQNDQTPAEDEALKEARRKRMEDERYAEYRRKPARESQEKSQQKEEPRNCENGEEEPEEEPYVPPTILIVSDIHFMSWTTHDDGDAFVNMMLEDDGKLSHCSDDIVEALIDEAIARGVSAVVIAGDNTLNGERVNHEELARRLRRLKDAGIPVLLVPGNHDINNTNAATYFGDKVEETEYLHSADEYYEIYEDFYEGANSRDPFSLSYVYPLDAAHWIMLLDSAWYEDRMHVDGRIRPETLQWMEDVFEAAEEVDALVVPVAHHNLLSESRYFTKECVMTNYDEVLEVLEAHHLPLFLSGHLHVQRIKKHKTAPGVPDDEYGITEIVSSPLSLAPCQYGILSWDDDDAMHYRVYSLADHMDEDLNYIETETEADTEADTEAETEADTFAPMADDFTKTVISNQIQVEFPSLPQEIREALGSSYADLYYLYCAGSYIDWDAFTRSEAYALWQKYTRTDEYINKMRAMAQDNTEDYHSWDSG